MASLTWLITGTSSGLGLALATHVLGRGHTLISLSRHANAPASLTSIAKEQKSTSKPRLYHITHDLSDDDPSNIKKKISSLLTENSNLNLDVLVNNAGIAAFEPLETLSSETLRQVMTTNFYSPFWLTQAILPNLRKSTSKTKVILNISSTQGLVTDAGEAAYDSSKHALEGMSGVLAKEVAHFGIRVVVVNLGSFRTSFTSNSKNMSEKKASNEEELGKLEDAYKDPEHPVRKRIDAVMKYAARADGARGDVNKAAAVLFDAVMQTPGSAVDQALARQRQIMHEAGSSCVSTVERLILGSDAQPKITRQAQYFNAQLVACENVSSTVDADGVQRM